MSGEDYLKKVKRERGLLEKIMSYIPGYRGYKEKELRRESDRPVSYTHLTLPTILLV